MTEFTKLTPSYQGGEFAKPEHVIEVQEAFAPIESELADHEARVTAAENREGPQRLTLYDEFGRYPNGAIDEQDDLPVIGANLWVATGAGVPTVTGGKLVSASSGYAVQQADGVIKQVFAVVEFTYSNPSTQTATIAICRDLADFGDNMVHFNFGPQGGYVLIQQDNAAYEQVGSLAWFQTVPQGQQVRIGMAVNGPIVTLFGPYGETTAVSTVAAAAALAGGGDVAFLQPGGGANASAFVSVSLFSDTGEGYDNPALMAHQLGALSRMRLSGGQVAGSAGEVYQVRTGRGVSVNAPAISFVPDKIFDELYEGISAGGNTFQTYQPVFNGSTIQIGNGATQETVTASGASSGVSAPFTVTITGTFASNHSAGEPLFVSPPAGAKIEIYYSVSQERIFLPNKIFDFLGGEFRLATDVRVFREAADVLALGTGDKLHLQSELELDGALNHDGDTVGFYNTTPVAKQTGVAVTAEGIHAALVALGLIGA